MIMLTKAAQTAQHLRRVTVFVLPVP